MCNKIDVERGDGSIQNYSVKDLLDNTKKRTYLGKIFNWY